MNCELLLINSSSELEYSAINVLDNLSEDNDEDSNISNYPMSIDSILSVEDVKNVKGIGKASLAFVEELLEQRKKNYFWKKMEEARKEYQGWHQWLWSYWKKFLSCSSETGC